jgi:hypothetical protein
VKHFMGMKFKKKLDNGDICACAQFVGF